MEEHPEKKLVGINKNKEPIRVRHADLTREDQSKYRSECPVCKYGFLPVCRDQETFDLLSEDRCLLCGQTFIYTDLGR